MKTFELVVITGYGNVGEAGLTSFTVEADEFDYGNTGWYRFTNNVQRENYIGFDVVAMYPINRTIIKSIKEK